MQLSQNMLYYILLSAVLAFHRALTSPLTVGGGDVDLFLGPDVSSPPSDDSSPLLSDSSLLFLDDPIQWPASSDDPSLNQLSPIDPNDNLFDEPQPAKLADINGLCTADENLSIVGKMRARDESSSSSSSCINPDANTNQFKKIDWEKLRRQFWHIMKEPIFDFGNKDEIRMPPPRPPVIPTEDNGEKRCPGDYGHYSYHLCCETYNGYSEDGQYRYYDEMFGCTPGTSLSNTDLKGTFFN